MRRRDLLAAPLALAFIASTALAGPEWEEPTGEDAGNFLETAFNVSTGGSGHVGVIKGRLTGNSGGSGFLEGDFQDLFRINIVNPEEFLAQTELVSNGLGDPMLFLFDRDGTGLAASNDRGDSDPQSKLAANDANWPLNLEAGIYYLAITSATSEAMGRYNNEVGPIFQMGLSEHQIGQWGPSGQFAQAPLDGWSPPTEPDNIGEYEILLNGVGSVPAPGAIALLVPLAIGVRRRRR